ncbi:rhamnogalacturonan acetylesterase [Thalassobellus suaedae]|uniref:Rhamnogalacturonan acetylesterase n=1 Tax=Thalassobellus suaedae TaxID=3074124 RepID=A0ABY9XZC9_9FLAO|nr:rhamnogalacturonan acetylesterase [Flavobacteriaceae bacterium HL-DH10]
MKNKISFNNNKKAFSFFLIFLISTTFMFSQNKKVKIYLVGDSTMCLYDDSRFPQEGWGMPFVNFFDDTVDIENHAKGGRSTKSFIDENRWQPILDSLQVGDYVLIQFGHNDAANSKNHPNRYTSPEDYKKYLGKYINEAKAKQANPILISPVTRMKFDKKGKVLESHAPYLKAVTEVAKEYQVPFIDLDTKSRELLEKLGPTFSRYLYMYFEPGELPRYPNGYKDNTHFNEFGARKMAELVLQGIIEQNLELANHVVKPYFKK